MGGYDGALLGTILGPPGAVVGGVAGAVAGVADWMNWRRRPGPNP